MLEQEVREIHQHLRRLQIQIPFRELLAVIAAHLHLRMVQAVVVVLAVLVLQEQAQLEVMEVLVVRHQLAELQ
jgi:hypothetical protein